MANRSKVDNKKAPFIGRRTLEVIKVDARRDSAGFERVSDYFRDVASSEERSPKKSTNKRQYIGRRTGKVISVNARKDSHGFERLSDYFPNEDSDTDDDVVLLVDDKVNGNKHGIKDNDTTAKTINDNKPESQASDVGSSPDSAFGSTKGGGETMSSGNDQDGEPAAGHTTTPYSGMVDGTVVDPESSPEQEDGLEITKKRLTFSMNATPAKGDIDKTSNMTKDATENKNISVSTVTKSRIPVPKKAIVTGTKRKAAQPVAKENGVSVPKKKQESTVAKTTTASKVVAKRGALKRTDNDKEITVNKAKKVVSLEEPQDVTSEEDLVKLSKKKNTRKSTPGNALSKKNSKITGSRSKNKRHMLESDVDSESGETNLQNRSTSIVPTSQSEEVSDSRHSVAKSAVIESGKKTQKHGRKSTKLGHNLSRSLVTDSEADNIQSSGSGKEVSGRLSSIKVNKPKGKMFSSSEDDELSQRRTNSVAHKTKTNVTANKTGTKPRNRNKSGKNTRKVTQAVTDENTSGDDTNDNATKNAGGSKKDPTITKNSKHAKYKLSANIGVMEDEQEVTEDCLTAEDGYENQQDDGIDENGDQPGANNQPGKPSSAKKGKRAKVTVHADNVRRSSRHRVPPLDYWKNERIEYDRRRSGAVVKEVIRVPSPETRKRKRTLPTKSKKSRGAKTKKVSEDVSSDDDFEELDGSFLNNIPEVEDAVVKVVNHETMEEVEMKILHTNKMLNLQSPSQKSGDDETQPATLLVDKFFSYGHFGAGEILLRPGAEKGVQHVRKDTMLFRLLSGRVLCTVHQQSFLLGKGSSFFVPDGNVYNIKNVSKNKDARLSFTQIKG